MKGESGVTLTRGERFIQSLRDERNVWIDGQRLDDVTAHPSFQGTLTTIKDLFDMLDDKQIQAQIGFRNAETGTYAHHAFLVPANREDLKRRRAAFSYWATETHGVMSRLSEFARSLVTGWYAARHEFTSLDPHFADKISRYYEQARDQDLFLTTALLDPQIDRTKSAGEHRNPDSVLRIVKETEEGVVVRGAKMIATAGPYAHDFLVYPYYRLKETEREYAHFLIVPANLPGLHIICRESFASLSGGDHPLSEKYDEMDAVLFFDDVLVPWERVFLKGDIDGVWKLRMNRTAGALAFHQTVVRLLAKLEFVTGVSVAVAQSIGADSYQHVQEKLGELVIQVESIKGLLLASEIQSSRTDAGIELPSLGPIETARNLGAWYYPRALDILQLIGAGGFMQVPSKLEDLNGPLGDMMKTYYAGKQLDADHKVRLFKLAWDLVGSPLGSRHELYERFYAGDPVRTYANQYVNADKSELESRMRTFRQTHYGKEAESDESTIAGQQLSRTTL